MLFPSATGRGGEGGGSALVLDVIDHTHDTVRLRLAEHPDRVLSRAERLPVATSDR